MFVMAVRSVLQICILGALMCVLAIMTVSDWILRDDNQR